MANGIASAYSVWELRVCQYLRQYLFRLWTKVHHVSFKTLVRIFPLAPKLSRLTRWILSQILNFRDFFFWGGGTLFAFGDGLRSLGQSLTRVKIWGGSTAWWPKCSLQKNVHLGWSIWATITFSLYKSSPSSQFHYFSPNVEGIVVDKGF